MSKLTNEVYCSLSIAREKIAHVKLIDLSLDDNPTELAALIKVHQLITEAMDLVADKSNDTTFEVSIPRYNSYTGVSSFQTVSLPVPASDLMLLANDKNKKIYAIKEYRERYGVSLAEAKYAIEQALGLEGKL